jgi:hypothetical protein
LTRCEYNYRVPYCFLSPPGERTKVRGFIKQPAELPQGSASISLILSFSPGGEKGLASKLQRKMKDKIFSPIPYCFLSSLGERTKMRGVIKQTRGIAVNAGNTDSKLEDAVFAASLRERMVYIVRIRSK